MTTMPALLTLALREVPPLLLLVQMETKWCWLSIYSSNLIDIPFTFYSHFMSKKYNFSSFVFSFLNSKIEVMSILNTKGHNRNGELQSVQTTSRGKCLLWY